MAVPARPFSTINEVSSLLGEPPHVLRFWETRFQQVRPVKRAGSRRYYRIEDVSLLQGISVLTRKMGYTIRGVQRVLKVHGVEAVIRIGKGGGQPEADLELSMAKTGNGTKRQEFPAPSSGLSEAEHTAIQDAISALREIATRLRA